MSTSRLGSDQEEDHYLSVEGTNVVPTDSLNVTLNNLTDVVTTAGMGCIYGDAGLGKTLAVNQALRALAPDCTIRLQFRSRSRTRDIRHLLFDALEIDGTPATKPIVLDHLLKRVLSERFRVLVCDEAQWMLPECFEYWRYLWDDPCTELALVFVGGGDCYQKLRSESVLSSRIRIWQQFHRMTGDQVLKSIPEYHPLWANVDPDDILFADSHACNGNFRAWAKLTAHAVIALSKSERATLDRQFLARLVSRIGGRGA
ncbi:hypothetical protein GCM10023194_57140 [Planotetraspora phitsanulokensis]|uniref:ORC1/DEAH AAA+ ATPase domain-containing protein n=1 Tax=Planotetraspora phitsanulokensis TaxID=575192 RepID=A0A8J3XKF6_9ACTN|nr:ATP-binding protein [Planotetraspora phitsanulokensis]GII43071.1 hypothetical protein Pph01_80740 [Planotetraspora phitsanulokensis]